MTDSQRVSAAGESFVAHVTQAKKCLHSECWLQFYEFKLMGQQALINKFGSIYFGFFFESGQNKLKQMSCNGLMKQYVGSLTEYYMCQNS